MNKKEIKNAILVALDRNSGGLKVVELIVVVMKQVGPLEDSRALTRLFKYLEPDAFMKILNEMKEVTVFEYSWQGRSKTFVGMN